MGFSIVGQQQIEPAQAILTQPQPRAGETLPPQRQPTFSPIPIDEKRGAPIEVRNLVGGAPPGDQLATLRQFFPDAQRFGQDNFVFTDPQTGEPTLYNPKGLDVGDVASVTPEIAEVGGGIVGGIAATPPALAGSIPTSGLSLLGIPAGVGLGAAGAREVENLIATNLFDRIDTRGTSRRVLDAAVTAGVNATGQRLGELAGQGISLVLGRIRQPGQASVDQFAQEGVRAPAGAVSGNRAVQALEQALSNMTPAADIMQRAAQQTIQELDTAVTRTAGRFGPGATRLEAGQALQRGATEFVGSRATANTRATGFLGRAEGFYNNLGRFIPADTPQPLSNTVAALTGPQGRFPTIPELGEAIQDSTLGRWAQIIEEGGGQLTWPEIRELRSFIGRKLAQPQIISDIPRADLEAVYAALSRDLQGIAERQGPAAVRAFTRADRFYRAGLGRIETISSALDDGIGPEGVFRLAIQQPATAGAAKESIATLRAYRRSVPAERWDVVAGTTLRNLGRAKPGVQDATGEAFSVATFLTNWNRMSPEARATLFGGTRYAQLSDGLDNLVRIASSLKSAEKMANPSGTARNLYAMVLLSSLAGGGASSVLGGEPGTGLVAGAAAVLVPRQAAKLITSPGFVNWIGQATRVNVRDPNSVTAHIGRLTAIATAEPEIREEVEQYLIALRGTIGGTQGGPRPSLEGSPLPSIPPQ